MPRQVHVEHHNILEWQYFRFFPLLQSTHLHSHIVLPFCSFGGWSLHCLPLRHTLTTMSSLKQRPRAPAPAPPLPPLPRSHQFTSAPSDESSLAPSGDTMVPAAMSLGAVSNLYLLYTLTHLPATTIISCARIFIGVNAFRLVLLFVCVCDAGRGTNPHQIFCKVHCPMSCSVGQV